LRKRKEASKSSMGTILMRKYFMPIKSLMVLALVGEIRFVMFAFDVDREVLVVVAVVSCCGCV
jgi:hypothetical protein